MRQAPQGRAQPRRGRAQRRRSPSSSRSSTTTCGRPRPSRRTASSSAWRRTPLRCTTLSSKIKEAKERAEGLNGEEELLGFPRSTFPQLEEAPSILAPYLQLWNVAQDFQKKTYAWLNGPMQGLDPESLEREIKDMSKANFKSMKFFENSETELPAPLRVAEQLKEQMDEFQTKLPLISCLCNPGMRERHWAEVSKLLGYPFKPTDSTTLASMLTMGLEQHLPALDEIGGGASKEYSLEKALDKMLADWQPLELTMVEYRDTGTSIVGGTEEIQMLLDDHVVKSQTMQGSPFIKPFAERAKAWGDKLVLIQDLVDIWLKVQGVWQYLEPIFGSEDIMRQMPKEGALFKKQDGMWRDNVNKVKVDVRVLVVADIPGILESYQEQQETLELVQKGLNDYLEMKRLYFPRFFFLSNDEMLEILSETKDPTRVQPHLGKCFEGIGKLVFEENNLITGMVSGEGETVPFGGENIQPSSMVEQWLVEVEERMFKSMARVVRESNAAHKQTTASRGCSSGRARWSSAWPDRRGRTTWRPRSPASGNGGPGRVRQQVRLRPERHRRARARRAAQARAQGGRAAHRHRRARARRGDRDGQEGHLQPQRL